MNRYVGFLAIGLVASLASPSRGDYSYTTLITPASQAFGATSVAGFFSSAGTGLSGNQNISLSTVTDTTATPFPATDTGIINYTIQLMLVQSVPDIPGTGTITVTGFLTFSRSDTKGEISKNTVTSITGPLTIQNETYTLSQITYAQPTVNAPPGSNSAGTISGLLTVSPVPEPASIAIMGVGGLLLAAPVLRRHVRRLARLERN